MLSPLASFVSGVMLMLGLAFCAALPAREAQTSRLAPSQCARGDRVGPHAGAAGCRPVAAEVGELLATKAGQGVGVAILYDALGSFGTSKAFFEILRRRGVSVCAFNPVNPVRHPGYSGINHHDHRKILVADARARAAVRTRIPGGLVGDRARRLVATRHRPAPDRAGRPHRGAAAVAVRRSVSSVRQLFLRGTFAPALRASDSPIAMACLRLVTFLPEVPLLSVPFFSSCSALATLSCAFGP